VITALRIVCCAMACWVIAGLACAGPVQQTWAQTTAADDRQLAAWASANLHELSSGNQWSDLEPLRQMLGDASLVSLGEGLHGSAEPLEFRNRLFQFLVERLGFTAIALESGITESYAINAYVLGGPGDPRELTARGITSGLGAFPQQAALVRWMRDYNSRHARVIQFYGMDLSGFPAEPDSPLELALKFLERVDGAPAKALRARLAPLIDHLKIDRFSDGPKQYSLLSPEQRDAATAVVADLVVLFETREGAYVAATSDADYELAYRAAIAARQADEYLRQVPVGWSAKSGPQSIMGTVAVADRAKLENIQWIRERQGRDGKVLIFTHLGHAAPTAVTVRLGESETLPLPPMVGTYLKRRYGKDLVTIGHFFALDTTDCKAKRDPAPPGSLEAVFASLGKPAFLLDLRPAPAPVRKRLEPMHDLYGQRPVHSLRVDQGVDIVLFTDRVTRSVPCP